MNGMGYRARGSGDRPGSAPGSTAVVAPRRLPVLGHAVPMLRHPLPFLVGVRSMGDIVVVRLGRRPAYVVNSPELIRRVLVDDADKFDRGRLFEKARSLVGHGLATSDGALHMRQRRIMQPAFGRPRIAGYVEDMRAEAVRACSAWSPGQVLDVPRATADLALSVTARALFRTDISESALALVHEWLPVIVAGLLPRVVAPDFWERVPTRGNRRFAAALDHLRALVDEVIERCRTRGADEGSLLADLLAARHSDSGEPMSEAQLRDEVMTILMSGTETTASAMAWMFHEIGADPAIERRFHSELDAVLGDREATFADIARLPYTAALGRETLRRHSPLWFAMRRARVDVELGGVRVPAGTQVLYSLAALHRDPKLYPDPLRFDPSRWTGSERHRPGADPFLPFGVGRHKCIGESFAWAEMTTLAATVGQRWRLRPVGGRRVREAALATLRPHNLHMVAEPRSPRPTVTQADPTTS